jgi:hypothetical protein
VCEGGVMTMLNVFLTLDAALLGVVLAMCAVVLARCIDLLNKKLNEHA